MGKKGITEKELKPCPQSEMLAALKDAF